MIDITVTDDKGQRRKLHFDLPRIRIGRADDNDLVLDSHACSRHHAEIIARRGTYQIVDLGSTNGIKVGETRVPDLFLTDGAVVVVGDHTLSFSIAEAASDKTVLLDRVVLPTVETREPEPRGEPPALYLVYRQNGKKRSLKIVAGARYVIGRSPDADLVVDDSRVSKRHALVNYEAHRFHLCDLGSSNGTVLNGRAISREPLGVGDEILIGKHMIVVQDQRLDLEDDAVLLGKTRLGLPLAELRRPAERTPPERAESERETRLGPLLFAGAVLLLAVGAFFVWRDRQDEGSEVERRPALRQAVEAGTERLVVRVAPVATKELARVVRGSGTIRPHRTVRVSAEIPGQVRAIFVDEGSTVEKGDLLAQLNDSDIRLQLDEARAGISKDRVDLAREDWERMQRLFDDGVASRALVDQSKSQYLNLDSAYKSAQARVRQLQEQLRKAGIRAPMSGRVAKRLVNQGEFLAPGGAVAVVENMAEVLVELEVSDRDIVKVQPGQAVEAVSDAFPDRVFRGVVDSAATAANPVTRTFMVEARIDNRDGSLRSGMIASLRILLEESRGTVVPVEALIDPTAAEPLVFVAADGVARRRAVGLGERWDREVEVLSGLSPGDEVIVSGKERLEDGQSIEVYRGQ